MKLPTHCFTLMSMAAIIMPLCAEKGKNTDTQVQTKIDRKLIEDHISKLGHKQYKVRRAAMNSLKILGKPTVSFLRRALTNDDPEVRENAKEILRVLIIKEKKPPAVTPRRAFRRCKG